MASQVIFIQPLVIPLCGNSLGFCPQFPWALFIVHTYIDRPKDRPHTQTCFYTQTCVYTHMHIYAQTHPCTYIFPPCIFNSVWFVCYVHVCLCMCVGTLVPVGTHAGQRFLPVRLPFFNLLLETSSLIWVDWLISEPLGFVCALHCFGITDKAPAHLVFIWVLESLNSSPLACTTDTFIH